MAPTCCSKGAHPQQMRLPLMQWQWQPRLLQRLPPKPPPLSLQVKMPEHVKSNSTVQKRQ